MLAAQLLVGPWLLDRFQTRCHTKRDMLGPPGWELGMGLPSLPHKNSTVSNPGNGEIMAQKWVKFHRRRQNKYWNNQFNTQVNIVLFVVIVVFVITITRSFIHSFSSLSYNRSIASSKRVLHRVLSRAPSFNFQYPLVFLRPSSSCLNHHLHLPITSILPSIFLTTKSFRRQFLCKMWPIQSLFLLFVWHSPPPWLTATVLHFSHNPPNWSSSTFSSIKFQNLWGISHLLSDVSTF